MRMTTTWDTLDSYKFAPEAEAVARLQQQNSLSQSDRNTIYQ
jgi:hypothetical protein